MYVIEAENVNEAMAKGLNLILEQGVEVSSRNGRTLEVPCPVTTVYRNPGQRVLVSQVRDANPFFHLMESLWILAGRNDVKFLNEFNKRMVEFSDDEVVFNAPYGYRLRSRFNDSNNCDLDQIEEVIKILSKDPNSRQAVCQIWDTEDLNKTTKDKACNMSIVFRIRNGRLDMTVYNRSNDMVWGAYGANVVQFSMIQEYVAARLSIRMGTYTQVSNSFHVYLDGPGGKAFNSLVEGYDTTFNPYQFVARTVRMEPEDMAAFDKDLSFFFSLYDEEGLRGIGNTANFDWESKYFLQLVLPMLCLYIVHKDFGPVKASMYLQHVESEDWRMAAGDWLEKRAKIKGEK